MAGRSGDAGVLPRPARDEPRITRIARIQTKTIVLVWIRAIRVIRGSSRAGRGKTPASPERPAMKRLAAACLTLLAFAPAAPAGLYYSHETVAELPSQWRGFL